MFYQLRISSPISESWVFLSYFVLIAMVYIATRLNQGTVAISFRTLYSAKERDSIFYIGSADIRSQILITLFCIGMIALNVQLAVFQSGTFRITDMLLICLLVVAVFILQYTINRMLAYVFFDGGVFQVAIQHYERLIIATATILMPITIITIYTSATYPALANSLYWLVAIFFFGTLTFKIFRLFFNKILDSVYILLYLLLVEIVPLASMIYVAQMIVSK